MEIIIREATTWEAVLAQWIPPQSLVTCWEKNRKTILEICNARYPRLASVEHLNVLVRGELRPFLIEIFPDPPKPQPRPQQQIDVSRITAEQIRQRAAQSEQDRKDEEQRLRDSSKINHAHPEPPPISDEERRKAFLERQGKLRHVLR